MRRPLWVTRDGVSQHQWFDQSKGKEEGWKRTHYRARRRPSAWSRPPALGQTAAGGRALLTAEVTPPGHGVRRRPARTALQRPRRHSLPLPSAPSLDGDWRRYRAAPLTRAPPGGRRARHRGRSLLASLQGKAPEALSITPMGPSSNPRLSSGKPALAK